MSGGSTGVHNHTCNRGSCAVKELKWELENQHCAGKCTLHVIGEFRFLVMPVSCPNAEISSQSPGPT